MFNQLPFHLIYHEKEERINRELSVSVGRIKWCWYYWGEYFHAHKHHGKRCWYHLTLLHPRTNSHPWKSRFISCSPCIIFVLLRTPYCKFLAPLFLSCVKSFERRERIKTCLQYWGGGARRWYINAIFALIIVHMYVRYLVWMWVSFLYNIRVRVQLECEFILRFNEISWVTQSIQASRTQSLEIMVIVTVIVMVQSTIDSIPRKPFGWYAWWYWRFLSSLWN